MKRQQRTVGAIVKIPLKDNEHSYAVVLPKACFGVFDVKTNQALDIGEIYSKKILFIVAVYNAAVTSGRWEKIGKVELDERFETLPMHFIQDPINPTLFRKYNPNTGEMFPATKQDCLGLECAAVWQAEHVEDRIWDYHLGRENKWVQLLRIK